MSLSPTLLLFLSDGGEPANQCMTIKIHVYGVCVCGTIQQILQSDIGIAVQLLACDCQRNFRCGDVY